MIVVIVTVHRQHITIIIPTVCPFQVIWAVVNILMYTNNAVNFILYCIMSQQFRNTFKSLFACDTLPFNLDRKVSKSNGTEYSMVKTETTNV